MKHWYGMVLAILLASLLPKEQHTDISQLHPVEILYIDMEGRSVQIATDTGEVGQGNTWQAALGDLKETASGELFVDTAAFLLVTDRSSVYLEEMAQVQRPSIKVLLFDGEAQWETLTNYLRWKNAGISLWRYRTGDTKLPKLVNVEGRCSIA